jgi:hypothetical protein
MKKILLILLVLLPTLSMGQLAFKEELIIHDINLHLEDIKIIKSRGINNNVGPIMLASGAAFLLGGALTKPDRTLKDGTWQNKPFLNQGPRAWATLSGIGLFCGGIVYMINN